MPGEALLSGAAGRPGAVGVVGSATPSSPARCSGALAGEDDVFGSVGAVVGAGEVGGADALGVPEGGIVRCGARGGIVCGRRRGGVTAVRAALVDGGVVGQLQAPTGFDVVTAVHVTVVVVAVAVEVVDLAPAVGVAEVALGQVPQGVVLGDLDGPVVLSDAHGETPVVSSGGEAGHDRTVKPRRRESSRAGDGRRWGVRYRARLERRRGDRGALGRRGWGDDRGRRGRCGGGRDGGGGGGRGGCRGEPDGGEQEPRQSLFGAQQPDAGGSCAGQGCGQLDQHGHGEPGPDDPQRHDQRGDDGGVR